ncbi:MAG: hypothetical protein ACXWVS_08925 [Hyphomicrobium sp.]
MAKREASSQARHKRVKRAVHHHQWDSLEEWVRTLDELSELSDAEIDDLARMTANDSGAATNGDE